MWPLRWRTSPLASGSGSKSSGNPCNSPRRRELALSVFGVVTTITAPGLAMRASSRRKANWFSTCSTTSMLTTASNAASGEGQAAVGADRRAAAQAHSGTPVARRRRRRCARPDRARAGAASRRAPARSIRCRRRRRRRAPASSRARRAGRARAGGDGVRERRDVHGVRGYGVRGSGVPGCSIVRGPPNSSTPITP